jgi:hypothetical protein
MQGTIHFTYIPADTSQRTIGSRNKHTPAAGFWPKANAQLKTIHTDVYRNDEKYLY